MKVALSLEQVNQLDLSHLAHFLSWNPPYQSYFLEPAGKEPYKLLAFLANAIQGDVCDLGTLHGSSALALSYNESNSVLSVDTRKHIPDMQGGITILNRPNVKFLVVSAQAIIPHVAKSSLVYMDFDSQNVDECHKVVCELDHYQFKGILVINDIYLNESMKSFWKNIPSHLKKIDATSLGHYTGTGIIVYHPDTIDVDLN